MPLHHTQPCPDPAPCRFQHWIRSLRRWFSGIRTHTRPYIPEHVDEHELRRVEDYANGGRRLMLYTTGVADWKHRRDQVENALSQALLAAGLATTPARSLRLHGGSNGSTGRLQCWGIPAPHGPEVLGELAGLLAVAHDLGLGRDIHVRSD